MLNVEWTYWFLINLLVLHDWLVNMNNNELLYILPLIAINQMWYGKPQNDMWINFSHIYNKISPINIYFLIEDTKIGSILSLMIFHIDDYELVTQMAIFLNIWTFKGYSKVSLKIPQNTLKYVLWWFNLIFGIYKRWVWPPLISKPMW